MEEIDAEYFIGLRTANHSNLIYAIYQQSSFNRIRVGRFVDANSPNSILS